MEWIPDALTVLGELFGLTGLILVLATGMIIAAIYYNRKNDGEPAKSVADAVKPITCQWSEFDASALKDSIRKQGEIHEEVKQANRRLERLEVQGARLQGYLER